MYIFNGTETLNNINFITGFAKAADQALTQLQNDLTAAKNTQKKQLDAEIEGVRAENQKKADQAYMPQKQLEHYCEQAIEKMDAEIQMLAKSQEMFRGILETSQDFKGIEPVPEYDRIENPQTRVNLIMKEFMTLIDSVKRWNPNGLFYILDRKFSDRRVNEYFRILSLYQTVQQYRSDVHQFLQQKTEEVTVYFNKLSEQMCRQLTDQYNRNLQYLEGNYQKDGQALLEQFSAVLDRQFPQEWVRQYAAHPFWSTKAENTRLITGRQIKDGSLGWLTVSINCRGWMKSEYSRKIFAGFLKQKLGSMADGLMVRVPMGLSAFGDRNWRVSTEGEADQNACQFAGSLILRALCSVPVGKLALDFVDPSDKCSSMPEVQELKKYVPSILGSGIAGKQTDIAEKLRKLTDLVSEREEMLSGKGYRSVYEMAEKEGTELPAYHILFLFDGIQGLNENEQEELANVILPKGPACGLIAVFVGNDDLDGLLPDADVRFRKAFDNCLILEQYKKQLEVFTVGSWGNIHTPIISKDAFHKETRKYQFLMLLDDSKGNSIVQSVREAYFHPETSKPEAGILPAPLADQQFPEKLRVGFLTIPDEMLGQNLPETERTVPFWFSLRDRNSIFLDATVDRAGAAAISQSLLWAFISQLPVSKLKVNIIDPEGRGQSIRTFLDFRKRTTAEKADVIEEICTDPDQISECLRKYNAEIDSLVMDKLGSRFDHILDYNAHAAKRAEPIRLLLLYNFPNALDGRSLSMLKSIVKNGPKCGVYTILIGGKKAYNANSYDQQQERVDEILTCCTQFDRKEGFFAAKTLDIRLRTDPMPTEEELNRFTDEYIETSKKIRTQGVSFDDIAAGQHFRGDSTKGLRIPIGFGDGDAVVNLNIGTGLSHHGLIAGSTGSGKTGLLHAIILSSILHYSPDELQLYLMDFKSGTEFKVYDGGIPHIRLLAVDARQEFGESILEELNNELKRRSVKFKETGATDLASYRSITGKKMPRILIIMDEFQILYNDVANRSVAVHCAELTKVIVSQGRSYGMHLLMATQLIKTANTLALPSATIEDMHIRIGMKCIETEARYMFSDRNADSALKMMQGPIGTGVLNQDYAQDQNIGFRAAWCSPEVKEKYLKEVRDTYKESGAEYFKNYRVFDGGSKTNLLDYFREQKIGWSEERKPSILIGEKVQVAPPLALTLDRRMQHNLLICGSEPSMEGRITRDYLVSAVLNRKTEVYCVDGASLIGEEDNEDFYNVLSDHAENFHMIESRGEIIQMLRDVYGQFRRAKKSSSSKNLGNTIIFFHSLQYIDIVKSMLAGEIIHEESYLDDEEDEDEEMNFENGSSNGFGDAFGTGAQQGSADSNETSGAAADAEEWDDPFAAVNALFAAPQQDERDNRASQASRRDKKERADKPVGQILEELIRDGYSYGIHCVITATDYNTVKEYLYRGKNLLPRFTERILFSLGEEATSTLLEGSGFRAINSEDIAYYSDGVKPCFQVKPYIAPEAEDLARYLEECPQ